MGVRGNEIDFLTMKTLRENEGYDVPWEFVRRRAGRSPAGTIPSAQVGSATVTAAGVGGCRGSNNENDIFQQAVRPERVISGKRANGRFSAGDDPSVNGCKKDNGIGNRDTKKPPVVAPKPAINSSNGSPSVASGANLDSGSSSTSACIFNKMPGDSVVNIIHTPPCGIRAQRIRKERYASGGCTPVGTVSASPALSKNVSAAETTDELASCVVWEYRKPEHDARPSCEYDAPWDSKRLSSGRETPSCHCPAPAPTTGMRHSTDGDAIYDEPWDSNKSTDQIKKAVLGLSFRSATRESNGAMAGNNSPSSTSRSSDSRASAATTASNDSDRLDGRRSTLQMGQEQYPDVVSIKSSPSMLANRQNGRNGVEKKANGSARTPVQVETAFVAKATPSTPATIGSKKRFQDKDRLIQQLCSAETVVAPVPPSAPRRSVNMRNSTELQNRDRRSLDDRPRNDQPAVVVASRSVGKNEETVQRELAVVRATDVEDAQPAPDYDTPWEFTNSPETVRMVRDLHNAQQGALPAGNPKKPEAKSKLNRQHLSLNFGCAGLNPTSAKIDTGLPLNEQMWYHGNITRAEAEQRLSKAVEGSFLVRVCESSIRQGEEYALSLKSAKGFMHMKIQQDAQRNWILGYFSQPFESIPVMIRYYSANKLPIKGAEHMRLLRPVADQVL